LPGFSDDNAIATDKTAYLPGTGTVTFNNVSSYTLGINGLMVDLAGSHGTLTAADFIFKQGNNNSPSTWSTAVGPTAVITRAAAGAAGSDRVELVWASGTLLNTWLEVVVRGNDTLGGSNLNTGLAASDVFFFGSAPADSGAGDSTTFLTNTVDEQAARNNPHSFADPATITNTEDYNRDALVNVVDQQAVRNFANSNATALKILSIDGAGPFAPQVSVPPGASPSAAPAATIAPIAAIAPAEVVSALANHADLAFALSSTTFTAASDFDIPGGHMSHLLDEQLLDLLAWGRDRGGWRGRGR
jgi:hypothetical protein